MIAKILKVIRKFPRPASSDLGLKERQSAWDARWADPDFQPDWQIETVPLELQEAVNNQWFQSRGTVLDIGCGAGECAYWLASQGYSVVGVDFSSNAIERARASFPENEQLRFQVNDVLQLEISRTFHSLFDRGCLHGIPGSQRASYVRAITTVSAAGTHFLLLHKLAGENKKITLSASEQLARQADLSQQIRSDFSGSPFEIIDMKLTTLFGRTSAKGQFNVPALAAMLVHK